MKLYFWLKLMSVIRHVDKMLAKGWLIARKILKVVEYNIQNKNKRKTYFLISAVNCEWQNNEACPGGSNCKFWACLDSVARIVRTYKITLLITGTVSCSCVTSAQTVPRWVYTPCLAF